MKINCPDIIGGAKVILFTTIDNRHKFTGNTKQIVGEKLMGKMSGLAICKYENESSFYLFGCNEEWKSITDTWHESIEGAINQAEFEYDGTKDTWIKK